jgi:hypothetical protein
MRIPPQTSSASIVAVGNFNPLILRPGWLKNKELIVGSDYEALQVEVIHPEIVAFQLPWGRVHCDRNQFSVTTLQEPLISVADFFEKCFQILPETPMNAVGINREIHFPAGSQTVADRIGDTLAPKQFWGDLIILGDKRFGGLRSLIMEQTITKDGVRRRLDGRPGYIHFRVEPSQRKDVPFGIFSQVNDHYDLPDSDGRAASELVSEMWNSAMARAEAWFDKLMSLADVATS